MMGIYVWHMIDLPGSRWMSILLVESKILIRVFSHLGIVRDSVCFVELVNDLINSRIGVFIEDPLGQIRKHEKHFS